jgi:hypothetical protein
LGLSFPLSREGNQITVAIRKPIKQFFIRVFISSSNNQRNSEILIKVIPFMGLYYIFGSFESKRKARKNLKLLNSRCIRQFGRDAKR